jgi:hypothetical protein
MVNSSESINISPINTEEIININKNIDLKVIVFISYMLV